MGDVTAEALFRRLDDKNVGSCSPEDGLQLQMVVSRDAYDNLLACC